MFVQNVPHKSAFAMDTRTGSLQQMPPRGSSTGRFQNPTWQVLTEGPTSAKLRRFHSKTSNRSIPRSPHTYVCIICIWRERERDIYIYIYIWISIRIHKAYIHICTCMCVCIYTYIYVYICLLDKKDYICMYIHVGICFDLVPSTHRPNFWAGAGACAGEVRLASHRPEGGAGEDPLPGRPLYHWLPLPSFL